jgi:ribosomal protein S18 acetylase RimI-like enzyme
VTNGGGATFGIGALARIRDTRAEDAARIGKIARAAYETYVPRIGRARAPMTADFAVIAAGRVVVIELDEKLAGYIIAWPQPDAYFIDNIAVDPAWAGPRPGTAADGSRGI